LQTGHSAHINISNVLHIPVLDSRILSTRVIAQRGADIWYGADSFCILIKGQCVASGRLEDNLYWLYPSAPSLNTLQVGAPSLHTWHMRMGHMSHMALKSHGSTAITGMKIDTAALTIPNMCDRCELGKSTCGPFTAGSRETSRIFEIVHSDLVGPMSTKSIQGSVYFTTFVDDYLHNAMIYFLKTKDQFVQALQKFLAWGETQSSHKLRALHSD